MKKGNEKLMNTNLDDFLCNLSCEDYGILKNEMHGSYGHPSNEDDYWFWSDAEEVARLTFEV